MIELFQFPWSPFCLVQKRILEFGKIPHKLIEVSAADRSLIWRLTRQRYYQVPILRHGRTVLFETDDWSQVLAKYLETNFQLGLFPREFDGLQRIVWRYIEGEIEDLTFRLNDAHYREFVAKPDQCAYVRHKERKFGRGCLDEWRARQRDLAAELARRLLPLEQMVGAKPFLLDQRPRFVDFDLWGMLANFLYTGHYQLPAAHKALRRWYRRVSRIQITESLREELHPRYQRAVARSRRRS